MCFVCVCAVCVCVCVRVCVCVCVCARARAHKGAAGVSELDFIILRLFTARLSNVDCLSFSLIMTVATKLC